MPCFLQQQRFIINHYAGEVEYDTVNFCEKNKDIVSDNIKQIVNSVSIINDTTKVTSKINMKTVIIQFKNQKVQDKMDKIDNQSQEPKSSALQNGESGDGQERGDGQKPKMVGLAAWMA